MADTDWNLHSKQLITPTDNDRMLVEPSDETAKAVEVGGFRNWLMGTALFSTLNTVGKNIIEAINELKEGIDNNTKSILDNTAQLNDIAKSITTNANNISKLDSLNAKYSEVNLSNNQSIGNNEAWKIEFDNNGGTIDLTLQDNGRIKFNETGIYIASVNVWFAHNSTGARELKIIDINSGYVYSYIRLNATSEFETALNTSFITKISKDTVIELDVMQTSGASLDVVKAMLSLKKVG